MSDLTITVTLPDAPGIDMGATGPGGWLRQDNMDDYVRMWDRYVRWRLEQPSHVPIGLMLDAYELAHLVVNGKIVESLVFGDMANYFEEQMGWKLREATNDDTE